MQFLTNIDLAKNELQNAVLQNLAVAPASPKPGQAYYNTTDSKFYGWNGTTWIDITFLYTHPTGDGNQHVPATGTTSNGKVLKAGSTAGSASWQALTKSDVGLGSVDNTADSSKNVATAAKLTTSRKITIAGDVDGNATFDGSADTTITVALDPSGVTAGTYKSVTVDAKGRVTAATNPTTLSGYGVTDGVKNLGSTPSLQSGLESAKPAATGSGAVYLSTDTGSIWKDTANGTWTKMGGQDLAVASSTVLGGVKIGANLTIGTDGTLNANDNPASFIRRQERFTVTSGQTLFNLTKGSYQPNTGAIWWFFDGVKQDDAAMTETSSTSVTLPVGLPDGGEVLFEYLQVINIHPFPVHAPEHLPGGADPIQLATASVPGLMSSDYASKVDGITAGATKTEGSATNGNIKINGVEDVVYTHPTGDGNQHVPATGTTNNGKVLKAGATAGSAAWGSLTYSDVGALASGGTAAAATKLATGRTISATGDATGTSASFDGTGNASIPLTLAASGVTAGTYPKVTVDAKGRVTAGASLAATDIPTLTLSKLSDAGTAASKNTGTASGNVPILDANGKLDTNILPALAITNTFVVADQASMLALTAEVGDVAIRTDLNKSFILKTTGASTLANWQEFLTPTDVVTSVAGKTGAVTLVASDVGLGNVDNKSSATIRSEITSSNVTTALGYTPAQKKTATIGDGATTQFTVVHNLNSLDVTTNLREIVTNAFVMCDTQAVDANSIKLLFANAPTANQYSVTITG